MGPILVAVLLHVEKNTGETDFLGRNAAVRAGLVGSVVAFLISQLRRTAG